MRCSRERAGLDACQYLLCRSGGRIITLPSVGSGLQAVCWLLAAISFLGASLVTQLCSLLPPRLSESRMDMWDPPQEASQKFTQNAVKSSSLNRGP